MKKSVSPDTETQWADNQENSHPLLYMDQFWPVKSPPKGAICWLPCQTISQFIMENTLITQTDLKQKNKTTYTRDFQWIQSATTPTYRSLVYLAVWTTYSFHFLPVGMLLLGFKHHKKISQQRGINFRCTLMMEMGQVNVPDDLIQSRMKQGFYSEYCF